MVDKPSKTQNENGDAFKYNRELDTDSKFAALRKRYESILQEPVPERLRELVEKLRANSETDNGNK